MPVDPSQEAVLTFADAHHGWLLVYSGAHDVLYETRDGGLTWRHVPGLRHVGIVAAANGQVYATADGPNGRAVYGAAAANGRFTRIGPSVGDDLVVHAGAVYDYDGVPKLRGSGPPLVVIRDGTATASSLPCGRFTYADALAAGSGGSLFVACGSEPGAGNQLKRAYLSPDGGWSWRRIGDPPLGGYVGAAALGRAGLFYAGERSSLERTGDDGRTWTVAVTGSGSAGGLQSLAIRDGEHGYAVDGGPPSALYLTGDGGASWRRARLP